jgi:hypothetical protein
VRLLLDANLSGPRIARPLRSDGHDVLAVSDHVELEGLDDPAVLELTASERRILITRNSRDFAPLLREWAEAGRSHSGCTLIWTLDHGEFGAILRSVRAELAHRPSHRAWRGITLAI